MHKRVNRGSAKTIISFSVGLILLIAAAVLLLHPRNPDLEWISNYLGTTIPEDAHDIQYQFRTGQGFFIELSFKALPDSADRFTGHLCDGILHQGYNPFDAINTSEPSENAIFVKGNDFVYYSYSPHPSNLIFGNRCRIQGGTIQQIVVDKTNPDIYSVRFEAPNTCNTAKSSIPCSALGYNYVFPVPDSKLPIMVTGIKSLSDGYVLVAHETCIETQSGYYLSWIEEWKPFYGADVQILMDNQPMPPAFISEPIGALIPRYNDKGDTNGRDKSDNTLFQYCIAANWEKGLHTATITITTLAGNQYTYSWKFRIE